MSRLRVCKSNITYIIDSYLTPSSFAFKFLLSVFEYLKTQAQEHHPKKAVNDNDGAHACIQCQFSERLCDRIEKTCCAHLRWIDRTERVATELVPSSKVYFGWNYWATGKTIEAPDTDIGRSLSSMHFQLLKFAQFALKLKESTFKTIKEIDVKKILEENVKIWIKELDHRNSQGFYAFATRVPSFGDPKYRLEDHVWIWRLLQYVETLGLGYITTAKRKEEAQAGKRPRSEGLNKDFLLSEDYSSANFKTKVLQRFSVENTVTGQRMIAVRRSLAQTRFGLRARDTALFYEGGDSFLTETNPLWKATTDAQRLHEENKDDHWHDPLRYTLALLMATTKSLCINSRTKTDMVKAAKAILYSSSSENGLFPGRLNEETKQAEIFEYSNMRDYYWHVGFEVPYALWEMREYHTPAEPSTSSDTVSQKSKKEAVAVGVSHKLEKEEPVATDVEEYYIGGKNMKMKRSIPFNALIDRKSIVELSDEWLYPKPAFLSWEPDHLGELPTEVKNFLAGNANGPSERYDDIMNENQNSREVLVIDIPKTEPKKYPKTQSEERAHDSQDILYAPSNNKEIQDKLYTKRSVYKAKKRLLWFFNFDANIASLGIPATPETGQQDLTSFFARHNRQEKFFSDDATAAANLWVTEFHLASYQFLSEEDYKNVEPRSTDLMFLGEKDGKQIRRAAMGFYLVGDFFDRYWTCCVLEYEPRIDRRHGIQINPKDVINRFKERLQLKDITPIPGKRVWDQRKILELLLFDRMLLNITQRYAELLQEINDYLAKLNNLKIKSNSEVSANLTGSGVTTAKFDILSVANKLFSSSLNYDEYLTFSKQWPAIQYTLQVMEEDLTETFEKIGFWNIRETDRKLEQPRWTKNDESRYRSAIRKVTAKNNYRIRVLQRYLSDIKSLRLSLTDRLSSTRDDLAYKSSENVRYFTYVTLVLLPMGFATALFSTNVAPGGRLIGEMAAAAFTTLIVTGIALANGRRITNTFTVMAEGIGKRYRNI